MSDYQNYLMMSWTTEQDLCEYCDVVKLDEHNYIEGKLGHYCSDTCRYKSESVEFLTDYQCRQIERKQMGF